MPERAIYLDYNGTTPIDPQVLEAMLPYLREQFGNPSSQHAYGPPARAAVARAREQTAALIGASPDEIVFTSGGSEATNHALKGAAFAAMDRAETRRKQVIISAIEHPATLETAQALARFGFTVEPIAVDRRGVIDLDHLARALRTPTLIVSVMHANNETGTVQPVPDVSRLARAQGALVHVDAAQSAGKIAVDIDALGADLLTLAGHKLYAPKGIGVLYVRRGVQLVPLIHGASQESGWRAGTENVPYIVGFGAACGIAAAQLDAFGARVVQLRDRLWTALAAALGTAVVLNGHPDRRLPNTLNASFLGLIGSELLAAVPQVAASTGSACHDGRVSISPVLAAMGIAPEIARGAVRFSLGRGTTAEEVDCAASLVVDGVRRLDR